MGLVKITSTRNNVAMMKMIVTMTSIEVATINRVVTIEVATIEVATTEMATTRVATTRTATAGDTISAEMISGLVPCPGCDLISEWSVLFMVTTIGGTANTML